MKLSRAQQIRLGIFVATGVALLFFSILTIAGLRIWENRHDFKVRFHENVSGLEVSSSVKYQGVRIGRVEKIQIPKDDPTAVDVTIALNADTVLFQDTHAVLDASGLTGIKSINLTPGDPRKQLLKNGSFIPTAPSVYGELTQQAGQVVRHIEAISAQLAHFLRPANVERIEHAVDSIDGLARTIDNFIIDNKAPLTGIIMETQDAVMAFKTASNETAQTMQATRTHFDHLDHELTQTLRAVQRPVSKINPDDVAETVSSLKSASSKLDMRLSDAEVGKSIKTLNETLNHMDTLVKDVDLSVRSGREDFTRSLSYLRQAAEDLREFSRMIAQNPSILFRGREVRE